MHPLLLGFQNSGLFLQPPAPKDPRQLFALLPSLKIYPRKSKGFHKTAARPYVSYAQMGEVTGS